MENSNPPLFPITDVRFWNAEAKERIRFFLDEPRLAGPRAPRGVATSVVELALAETMTPALSPLKWLQAFRVVEFYDATACLNLFAQFLRGQELLPGQWAVSCQIVRILGEFGSPDLAQFASNYFQQQLLNSPLAEEELPLLLQTGLSLSQTSLSPLLLTSRLEYQQQLAASRVEPDPLGEGPGAITFRRTRDLVADSLPVTLAAIAYRRQMVSLPMETRTTELLRAYFGWGPFGDAVHHNWSGRALRSLALSSREAHAYVVSALSSLALQLVENGPAAQQSVAQQPSLLTRSAAALRYLHAPVPGPIADQLLLFAQAETPVAISSFLDDSI